MLVFDFGDRMLYKHFNDAKIILFGLKMKKEPFYILVIPY